MKSSHIKNAIRLALFLLLCVPGATFAATLRLSPDTGVYTVGNTFTANVVMNTQGKPVNAADATLAFNARELAVVSVNRSSSVFNLWTLEPTFSNSAGTISFGGGSPSGYTGGGGNIITITFRALAPGTPKVTFTSGSVLAADGMGTNVLTSMNGGTYTVSAKSDTPTPEYVPPANTPGAPRVTSATHPDETKWYNKTSATLSWVLPSDTTSVRTLLDQSAGTVPTIVYDEPISERQIDDLPQGTSYFHIQFKNADGWGRVTHYALRVDTESPKAFTIREDNPDTSNPNRTLIFDSEDSSPIRQYKVQLDGGEFIDVTDSEETGTYLLEKLAPGHHTVVVEAFDSAGNSAVATYSLDVSAFSAPVFTEYPERLTTGVVPALRGTTRASSDVVVTIREGERTFGVFTVRSSEAGDFTVIPDTDLPIGVYTVTAIATDTHGAQSDVSEPIRIIVEEPGYITIGTFVVRVLSVIIPLIALIIILVFGSWFLWWRLHRWRRAVTKETIEAEEQLTLEFDAIISNLHSKVTQLKELRKSKITKAEQALIDEIESDIRGSQVRIKKEITDIEHIVE